MIQTGIVSVTMSKFEYSLTCCPSFFICSVMAKICDSRSHAFALIAISYLWLFYFIGEELCFFISQNIIILICVVSDPVEWTHRAVFTALFLWHCFPWVYVCVCADCLVLVWKFILYSFCFVLCSIAYRELLEFHSLDNSATTCKSFVQPNEILPK